MVLLLLGHFLERFLNLLQRHAIKLIACSEKHKQITTLICDDAERKIFKRQSRRAMSLDSASEASAYSTEAGLPGGIVEKVKLFSEAGSDNFPAYDAEGWSSPGPDSLHGDFRAGSHRRFEHDLLNQPRDGLRRVLVC